MFPLRNVSVLHFFAWMIVIANINNLNLKPLDCTNYSSFIPFKWTVWNIKHKPFIGLHPSGGNHHKSIYTTQKKS